MAPKIIEVTHERAYEIAEELQDRNEYVGTTSTVFSGKHPEFGDIHIAIPPLGDSLVLPAALPVVVQNFKL